MKRTSILSLVAIIGILGAAHAASKQNVISGGTKVASAGENTVVSADCREKYNGCMDAFCMLDNESGGRCSCSDKNAEYESILADIEKLDTQTFAMTTAGVDMVESGTEITNQARDVAKKSGVDLSLWDDAGDEDEEEDVFDNTDVSGRTGDALRAYSHSMCAERMPECADELTTLSTMYGAQIRSDCAGYKNALEKRQKESTQKLATAEKALRDTALTQFKDANKYDLGQCTVEFKKCMQTTAECGSDFALCAAVPTGNDDMYSIKGAASQIDISMGTYNRLESKKIICDHVTKQCDAVAGQVWDTFLREIAPTLQVAELVADDAQRQNCAETVSTCFQTACKDNIDPSDPDGSYDLCLTRPETMLSFCKVELNKCGVDTSSDDAARESMIWDYVVARLASMRVNACTDDVKSCLKSADRCGDDYSQCIGLDTNTIIRMCPYEKMTGCVKVYGADNIRGDAVYDELSNVVAGLFVNVDNALLKTCQNAVDAAMIRVCGGTENCNNMAIEPDMGAGSLSYNICEYTTTEDSFDIDFTKCRSSIEQIADTELGRIPGNTTPGAVGPISSLVGTIDGTMYWNAIQYNAETNTITSADEYLSDPNLSDMHDGARSRIENELNKVQRAITSTINTIESDPKVQWCMTGRKVAGWDDTEFADQTPRFPSLTQSTRNMIAAHALKGAMNNYLNKYSELTNKMLADRAKIAERMADIRGENGKDVRRESARISCVSLPEMSAVPKSPEPPAMSLAGAIVLGVLIAIATIAACILTAGFAAGPMVGGMVFLASATPGVLTGISVAGTSVAIATSAGTALGAGIASAVARAEGTNPDDVSNPGKLDGSYNLNQWNYEEKITTMFNPNDLTCEKCTVSRNCKQVKEPMFGSKSCKTWNDYTPEECTTIQF